MITAPKSFIELYNTITRMSYIILFGRITQNHFFNLSWNSITSQLISACQLLNVSSLKLLLGLMCIVYLKYLKKWISQQRKVRIASYFVYGYAQLFFSQRENVLWNFVGKRWVLFSYATCHWKHWPCKYFLVPRYVSFFTGVFWFIEFSETLVVERFSQSALQWKTTHCK